MKRTHDPMFIKFLTRVLRKASYMWPPRAVALTRAKIGHGKYRCAHCGEIFKRMHIAVDHIDSVIPLTGFAGWDNYIERLFCHENGLQILCDNGVESCHKKKTKAENAERRRLKAEPDDFF